MDYAELAAASQPDALRAALAANADALRQAAAPHHPGELAAIRQVTYRGHDIVVRTTYEITVDGRPFDVHLTVDNSGRVHYHGLPTRDFPSVIDLVQKAIDVFGADFAADPPGATDPPGAADPPGGHGPGAHHHDHHDHSGGA